MADPARFYLTTAIDYPNSRPHIGTAFEKIGADVQARYRRMEGYDVFFLMGNDENTVKVAKRAPSWAARPRNTATTWPGSSRKSGGPSTSATTTSSRPASRATTPAAGNSSRRCTTTATSTRGLTRAGTARAARRSRPKRTWWTATAPITTYAARAAAASRATSSRCRKFQDRLLELYDENPDFIQPESRRNEVLSLVQSGLQDVNITRAGPRLGHPRAVRRDVYDLRLVRRSAELHHRRRLRRRTRRDFASGGRPTFTSSARTSRASTAPCGRRCFWPRESSRRAASSAHGFVYIRRGEKMSKTLGNIVEPMEIITKFSAEAFRYYFLRECPFPGDGDFSWQRFADVYNADLANNLGNLYSRVVTLITQELRRAPIGNGADRSRASSTPRSTPRPPCSRCRRTFEACQYNQALERIWRQILDPANQYADRTEPWKLVKTDKSAAQARLVRSGRSSCERQRSCSSRSCREWPRRFMAASTSRSRGMKCAMRTSGCIPPRSRTCASSRPRGRQGQAAVPTHRLGGAVRY